MCDTIYNVKKGFYDLRDNIILGWHLRGRNFAMCSVRSFSDTISGVNCTAQWKENDTI